LKIKLPQNVPLSDPTERARVLRALRVALEFLTVIPVPARFGGGAATEADVSAARYAFPIVGAGIGVLLALVSAGLSSAHAVPLLAAFLLVAAWVAITGGLHLDGLADSSDGLFLWGDPERRLTVMRDPHVGSFGLIAIVLVIVGKVAALAALTGRRRALAVVGAAVVSRTLILVAAGLAPYARPKGTGQTVVEATTVTDALWSCVATLALGAVLAGEAGLIASAASLVVAWSLSHIANQRLGGITGDILGAVVELGELVYLVALGLFTPS
jgi:adenosylcobinamide-GDP ribazoletransferase